MAQIGLRYLRYSKLDEQDKVTTADTLSEIIEMKVGLNVAEAKLYGSDMVVESAKMVTGGTLDIGITHEIDEKIAEILGHEYDATTKEVTKYSDDTAPYIAIGGIKVKIKGGKRLYKAEFYPKTQFKDFVADGKTAGDGIEFQTPTIQGDIIAVKVKDETDNERLLWSRTATFDNFGDASKWLDDLLTAPA